MSTELKMILVMLGAVLFIVTLSGGVSALDSLVVPVIMGLVWFVIVIKQLPALTQL